MKHRTTYKRPRLVLTQRGWAVIVIALAAAVAVLAFVLLTHTAPVRGVDY